MGLQEVRDQIARGGAAAEPLGKIIAVSGSTATIGVLPTGLSSAEEARTTVSKFVMIHSDRSRLIGVITAISLNLPPFAKEQGYRAIAEVDLMGEIRIDATGAETFWRGVSEYPAISDEVTLLTSGEFRLIYKKSEEATGSIGTLQQDHSTQAYININELLSKHFAILGTTGVGKSNGVVIILQQILETRPDVRLFLLDAHNEYGKCFGDQALVLNPRNLKLPFWLFNFEEIVDVFFGARAGLEDEVAILAETIPMAKSGYLRYRGAAAADRSAVKKADTNIAGFTVDTPVPYVLADLVGLIDERMGKLENRSTRMTYHKLILRIEAVRSDPRYAFMFENANVGGDTITEVLNQLFRLIPNGKPMTIMQLAGFPVEVVDAVVSVLGRRRHPDGVRVRGSPPLRFGRPQHRLRPHPSGDLAHRQGRAKIRCVSRARFATPRGARSDHPVPVQHALRYAHGQRSRPGDSALGRIGRRRQPLGLRAFARHPRNVCIRRRRRAANPPDLQGSAGRPAPVQRGRQPRAHATRRGGL
jgi:hypothetical protein